MAAEKSTRTLTALAVSRMKVGDELADTAENRGLRVTRTKGDHRYWYRFADPATGRQKALTRQQSVLLLLEPVTGELQRPTVFSHRTHHIVRRAIRYISLDLERDSHFGVDQSDQVRDHFLRDLSGVTPYAIRVQRY